MGAYFIMPNFPRTTTWLSDQEKALAVWRLEEDIGEDDWVNSEEQTFFHGAKLAVKDPKAWLLLATIYGFTSSGTVTTLFPSVVKGLGYGDVATLLLTVPPYVSIEDSVNREKRKLTVPSGHRRDCHPR